MRTTRKIYHDDEDDDDANIEKEEEAEIQHRQTLLLVNSGPPLNRDLSHEKMDFLQQFGLTTSNVADGRSPSLLLQSNYESKAFICVCLCVCLSAR